MNPEELLSHADFLGALARTLIFDDARAADIVQDTWAAALEKPPADESNPRAWLAAVARNFARMTARSESRRAVREKVAALPERAPSSDEIVAEEEVRRKVVEAVLSLDESYRSAIVLRYYRDLSHEDTAKVMGIPVATMRTYLQKGKALLRSRLDKVYHGDRKQWVVALAPFAGLYMAASQAGAVAAAGAAGKGGAAAGTGVSTLLSGVIAMSFKAKLGIVAALIIVGAALTTFTFFKPEGREEGLTYSPIETPVAVAQETRPAGPSEAVEENPRVAVVPAGYSEPDSQAAAEDRVRIMGRVVDTDGRAIRGVQLKHGVRHNYALVETGQDGRFTYLQEALTYEDNFDAVLVCERYATRRISATVRPADKELLLGDVVMKPGGRVAGYLTDDQGRPFAKGSVFYTDDSPISALDEDYCRRCGGGSHSGDVLSDDGGTFLLCGVPVGRIRVWAHADGMYYSFTKPVEVRAGKVTSGVELTLEALHDEDCIGGVVLDPSGNPLPRARLKVSYRSLLGMGSRSTATDEEGRFHLALVKVRNHDVGACDRLDRYSSCLIKDVAPGTTDLVLQLGPIHRLQVRILTAGGVRPKDLTVATYNAAEGFGHDHTFTEVDGLPKSGLVEVQVPDHNFMVKVDAPGFAVAKAGPVDPRAMPDPLEVTLHSLPGIRGQVTAEGEPVQGAKAFLHEAISRYESYLVQGVPSRSSLTGIAGDETDEHGAFCLSLRESGTYYLRVEKEGFAPTELGPLDLNHKNGLQGLEVKLTKGGSLEGWVLLPPGREPSGIIILASRYDGHHRTCRTGPDGSYRFDLLTPGPWDVRRIKEDKWKGSMSQRWDSTRTPTSFTSVCEVREGNTTRYDLNLGEGIECMVRGSLRLDGIPMEGWTVRLDATEVNVYVEEKEPIRIDGEGNFVIDAEKPGEYTITLSGPTGEKGTIAFQDRITVIPGETPWSLELELERLTLIRSEAPAEGLPIFHRWKGPGARCSYTPVEIPEGEDTCTLMVPPAPGEIIQLVPAMTALSYAEKPLVTIEDNAQPVNF